MAVVSFLRKLTVSHIETNIYVKSWKLSNCKYVTCCSLKIAVFFIVFMFCLCVVIASNPHKFLHIVDFLGFGNVLCLNISKHELIGTAVVATHLTTYESVCKYESRHLCYGENDQSSMELRVQRRTPVNPDIQGEALRALNQALGMQAQGKTKIAMKLFEHAHKMDPAHADILNEYGEFMEKHVKDIVLADHFYSKALLVEPEHTKAVVNRRRTLPVVETIDLNFFKAIDKKLQILHKVPKSHPGLRRASNEAFFNHIYHTNAIEGNTLTLSQTRFIIETRTAIGGKSLIEQNEVLGTSSAMRYITDNLINRVGGITLEHILDIHHRVLGHAAPLEAGHIRRTHVAVGTYEPPAPRMLAELMRGFITWLNSEEAFSLHPIEFAAIAHYRLVAIHPFYDGNGRTARLLMNLILMQYGYPPVTVKVEDRLRYYETLVKANDGDIRPFTRLIAECASLTLDTFLKGTHENYHSLQVGLIFGQEEKVITVND